MTSEINTYLQYSNGNPFASQAKMLFHSDRLNEYLTNGDTRPVFMEVNLTDRCNMRCKWCISANRGVSKAELNEDRLNRFLADFALIGGKALTFSGGGEPTLYKAFGRVSDRATALGLELGLMTNGFFGEDVVNVVAENYKWVRVSLDTVDETVYREMKGVKALPIVLENIKSLHGTQTKVGVNCNVGEHSTVEDIENLICRVYDYCDYIQFRPILPRHFAKEEICIDAVVWNKLDAYKSDPKINLSLDKCRDLVAGRGFPDSTCEGHFFSPVLDATGEVKVCMYHPGDPRFSFGNINEKSFSEIWKSHDRFNAIGFVRTLDYRKVCQACCKLCELNKLINFLQHQDLNALDVNFL